MLIEFRIEQIDLGMNIGIGLEFDNADIAVTHGLGRSDAGFKPVIGILRGDGIDPEVIPCTQIEGIEIFLTVRAVEMGVSQGNPHLTIGKLVNIGGAQARPV